MSSGEKIPNLPNDAQYLHGVLTVANRLDVYGGPMRGLARYADSGPAGAFGVSRVVDYVGKMADVINPRDRSTGDFIDDIKEATRAMRMGATAGMLVASESHLPFQVTAGGIIRFMPSNRLPHGMIDPDDIHEYADEIINMATTATAEIDDASGRAFAKLADRAIPQTYRSGSRYFNTGAGIVLIGALEYHANALGMQNHRDLIAMQQELDGIHDVNWDELLK